MTCSQLWHVPIMTCPQLWHIPAMTWPPLWHDMSPAMTCPSYDLTPAMTCPQLRPVPSCDLNYNMSPTVTYPQLWPVISYDFHLNSVLFLSVITIATFVMLVSDARQVLKFDWSPLHLIHQVHPKYHAFVHFLGAQVWSVWVQTLWSSGAGVHGVDKDGSCWQLPARGGTVELWDCSPWCGRQAGTLCSHWCNSELCCCCSSLLYSAILHFWADFLHSHVILCEWLAFYSTSFNIQWSGVLTALTWLAPQQLKH